MIMATTTRSLFSVIFIFFFNKTIKKKLEKILIKITKILLIISKLTKKLNRKVKVKPSE